MQLIQFKKVKIFSSNWSVWLTHKFYNYHGITFSPPSIEFGLKFFIFNTPEKNWNKWNKKLRHSVLDHLKWRILGTSLAFTTQEVASHSVWLVQRTFRYLRVYYMKIIGLISHTSLSTIPPHYDAIALATFLKGALLWYSLYLIRDKTKKSQPLIFNINEVLNKLNNHKK